MIACNKCNEFKDLTEFSLNKSGKFGRYSICKICRRNKFKLIGDIEKNKKKQKYAVDKTSFLSSNKKWYENNKESARIKKREYYKNNKEVAYASSAKRRASKTNASLGFEDEIKQVYKAAIESKKHVHHIVPLNEFSDIVCGLHVPWNLELLTKEEHSLAHEKLREVFNDRR